MDKLTKSYIYFLNKCCSFELSIYQRTIKNITVSTDT